MRLKITSLLHAVFQKTPLLTLLILFSYPHFRATTLIPEFPAHPSSTSTLFFGAMSLLQAAATNIPEFECPRAMEQPFRYPGELAKMNEDAQRVEQPFRERGHEGEDGLEEVDEIVKEDMGKLEESFPGISGRFRLVNRIGEGTVPNALVDVQHAQAPRLLD